MLIQIEGELQSLIVPCSRLVAAVKRDEQRLRGRNTNNNNNGIFDVIYQVVLSFVCCQTTVA